MTKTDAAWLAGIIDGEGYIRVIPPEIQVTNCDLRLLRKVKMVCGCGQVRSLGIPRSPKHRPAYRWYVRSKAEVRAILSSVHERLITKRARSRAVLRRSV